jgi:uncharacterized protein
MDNRWIQTYTGRRFYPLDPSPHDIDIEDIAHALSMKCRYAGHTDVFYSVAEHSVHVSDLVAPQNRLWGLLHDASEAYSADIPSPIKSAFPEWKAMEDRIMRAVCERFGLSPEEPPQVKRFDVAMLGVERDALFGIKRDDWVRVESIFNPPRIVGMSPQTAKSEFLHRFSQTVFTCS